MKKEMITLQQLAYKKMNTLDLVIFPSVSFSKTKPNNLQELKVLSPEVVGTYTNETIRLQLQKQHHPILPKKRNQNSRNQSRSKDLS